MGNKKQSRSATRKAAAPVAVQPSPATEGPSPQQFYREMVARPDVRAILKRLAQVEDTGA